MGEKRGIHNNFKGREAKWRDTALRRGEIRSVSAREPDKDRRLIHEFSPGVPCGSGGPPGCRWVWQGCSAGPGHVQRLRSVHYGCSQPLLYIFLFYHDSITSGVVSRIPLQGGRVNNQPIG